MRIAFNNGLVSNYIKYNILNGFGTNAYNGSCLLRNAHPPFRGHAQMHFTFPAGSFASAMIPEIATSQEIVEGRSSAR